MGLVLGREEICVVLLVSAVWFLVLGLGFLDAIAGGWRGGVGWMGRDGVVGVGLALGWRFIVFYGLS